MECRQCGREFHPRKPTQKFCSANCANVARRNETLRRKQCSSQAPPKKSLSEWAREAAECNLDYGTYRALVNAGKTFDELKTTAHLHTSPSHNKSLFPSGTRGRKLT